MTPTFLSTALPLSLKAFTLDSGISVGKKTEPKEKFTSIMNMGLKSYRKLARPY